MGDETGVRSAREERRQKRARAREQQLLAKHSTWKKRKRGVQRKANMGDASEDLNDEINEDQENGAQGTPQEARSQAGDAGASGSNDYAETESNMTSPGAAAPATTMQAEHGATTATTPVAKASPVQMFNLTPQTSKQGSSGSSSSAGPQHQLPA